MVDGRVFKVGDCPVCSGAGAVLVLRRVDDSVLVYYCPSCGCAWPEPPDPARLDSVQSLDEVAPAGVDLPERTDLMRRFEVGTLQSAEEWLEYLEI